MSPKISFGEKPTLTGELVLLRPVRAADAPGLAAVDPETLRLTGSHQTHSVEELQRWYHSRAEFDDRLDLAIVERSTGAWVGEVVLSGLDVDNRSCGFRILLVGPEFFGRGLGTEATRLVLAHAFDTVGLHRVDLEVYAFNPRARHVYEKVGFVHEGTQRHALRWDGAWIDAHTMAILAEEWAEHHGCPVGASAENASAEAREYTDHGTVPVEEQVMKASDVVDLLNKVEVDHYGTMTPLPQLTTVTIKDDTVVLVRPHDPSQFPALVYAIRNSNTGLTLSDDGKQIVVPVPA